MNIQSSNNQQIYQQSLSVNNINKLFQGSIKYFNQIQHVVKSLQQKLTKSEDEVKKLNTKLYIKDKQHKKLQQQVQKLRIQSVLFHAIKAITQLKDNSQSTINQSELMTNIFSMHSQQLKQISTLRQQQNHRGQNIFKMNNEQQKQRIQFNKDQKSDFSLYSFYFISTVTKIQYQRYDFNLHYKQHLLQNQARGLTLKSQKQNQVNHFMISTLIRQCNFQKVQSINLAQLNMNDDTFLQFTKLSFDCLVSLKIEKNQIKNITPITNLNYYKFIELDVYNNQLNEKSIKFFAQSVFQQMISLKVSFEQDLNNFGWQQILQANFNNYPRIQNFHIYCQEFIDRKIRKNVEDCLSKKQNLQKLIKNSQNHKQQIKPYKIAVKWYKSLKSDPNELIQSQIYEQDIDIEYKQDDNIKDLEEEELIVEQSKEYQQSQRNEVNEDLVFNGINPNQIQRKQIKKIQRQVISLQKKKIILKLSGNRRRIKRTKRRIVPLEQLLQDNNQEDIQSQQYIGSSEDYIIYPKKQWDNDLDYKIQ